MLVSFVSGTFASFRPVKLSERCLTLRAFSAVNRGEDVHTSMYTTVECVLTSLGIAFGRKHHCGLASSAGNSARKGLYLNRSARNQCQWPRARGITVRGRTDSRETRDITNPTGIVRDAAVSEQCRRHAGPEAVLRCFAVQSPLSLETFSSANGQTDTQLDCHALCRKPSGKAAKYLGSGVMRSTPAGGGGRRSRVSGILSTFSASAANAVSSASATGSHASSMFCTVAGFILGRRKR